MIQHFLSVLDECRAVIVNPQQSRPLVLEAIFRPTSRWFEPIWNLLDRQSLLFSKYYFNFNVWAVLDFFHLENWSDYICVRIFIRIKPNFEFVAARWIANWKKLISNVLEKFWMITEVTAISSGDYSSKLDHVWII